MKLIEIDKELCTGCQECTKVCPVYAIEGEYGKPQTIVEERCVMCGQCVQICKVCMSADDRFLDKYRKKREERGLLDTVNEPLFAAYNKSHLWKVKEALQDVSKIKIIQMAPSVRVSLFEDFELEFGKIDVGKIVAAFRKLGFDKVYDTNFGADLTIVEEGNELISRVQNNGILPMFTSCCPAWVRFVENRYPEFKKNLSTCKSPQQMEGAVIKSFGARKNEIDAANIFQVSVMPCTCKEYESTLSKMNASGYRDVDVVITTRELAYLIKDAGIELNDLVPETFDPLLGTYTGAGALFGITGGVMEATIRTGYELLTGESIKELEINEIRGTEGIRLCTIHIKDLKLRFGVVCGLKNAEKVLDDIKAGKLKVDFVEVMTCPQGCVSGGGQPKLLLEEDREGAYLARREALITHDQSLPLRESHKNPEIQAMYEEFLGEPGGKIAHHLLHI